MTVKISISLPDDIAERLSREDNASGYVAEALRRRFGVERAVELLAETGYEYDPERAAAMDVRMQAVREQMTPELASQGRAMLESYRRPRRA